VQAKYAARYEDRSGLELTSITNDGKRLSLRLRGVEFQGQDFDGLEPEGPLDPARLASFTLNHGELCACVIEAEIPIPIATPGGEVEGMLRVHLELGGPAPNGGIDREVLELALRIGERCLASSGTSGLFEDELLDIQKQLPPDVYMRACINCAFSDYNPAGQGLFGCLACFRDNKRAYLAVRDKQELFRIWDTMTEWVQETYLCPEFARRAPGTGYRG
jgi:hypothetical protein